MKFVLIILFFCINISLFAQEWQKLGGGASFDIRDFYADTSNNLLYVVGGFQYMDTIEANGIAVWNSNNWDKLDSVDVYCFNGGCNPLINIQKYNSDFFVSGNFGYYGNNLKFLRKWDGFSWSYCGNPNSIVNLKIVNNELFALGWFDTISNQNINRIAKWNGLSWESYALPLAFFHGNGSVVTAEFYKGEYYFAGNFSFAGGLNEIACWDGSQWKPLQNGIGGDSWINDIVVYKNTLFVGGYFFHSDGNISDFLMAWNGNQWFNPFPGIQFMGQVRDLEVINNKLYIVGNYIVPNDSGMFAFANYDGAYFNAFGGRAIYPYWPDPSAIAGMNGEIFVACNYVLFNDTVKYIAKWTGTQYDTSIYIPLSINPNSLLKYDLSIFPNPSTGSITVKTQNEPIKTIEIYNNIGIKVDEISFPNIVTEYKYNSVNKKNGMYLFKVKTNQNLYHKKVIFY